MLSEAAVIAQLFRIDIGRVLTACGIWRGGFWVNVVLKLHHAQTELMAAQYDAHLASEALRTSQERVSDLGFHMEDGEDRLAEMKAQLAHIEEQAAAADAMRAEAEARAADLAQQVLLLQLAQAESTPGSAHAPISTDGVEESAA